MQLKGIPFFVKNKCFLNFVEIIASSSEKYYMFMMQILEIIFLYVGLNISAREA